MENCLFRNIAATGVFVGGANCQPDDPDCTADITVANNDISGYGRKFYCAIGVHITFCNGAELSHNEISDGYYTAVSCGWVWGYGYQLTNQIKIRDNLIYNIGQGWLSDMGGIYMLGVQPGTELTGNVIHNVVADPGEGGYGGWGVYLDEGSSRMLVEKNLVFCCSSQSYNLHFGEGNVFRNNIGAFSEEWQVSPGSRGDETHATAFYYDNLFVTDNGAPIYVYMLHTGHFYENGNLFWDVSRQNALCFCTTDRGGTQLTLAQAKKQGFLHNETVADPLFNDLSAYDFTLREDSPAFALNFKAWDYDNAGTKKDSTVGFSLAGGQTAYNDHVTPTSPAAEEKTSQLSHVLLPLLLIFAAALVTFRIAWTLRFVPVRSALALGNTVIMGIAGWFTYQNFVDWNPALYMAGLTTLCAAAAVLPLCGAGRRKKPAFVFLLQFVCLLAGWFAVLLLCNNLLRLGEANAVCIAFVCLAIYVTAQTVRNLRKKA